MDEHEELLRLRKENEELKAELELYRRDGFYPWLHQAFQDFVLNNPEELGRWCAAAESLLTDDGTRKAYSLDMAEALLSEELEDALLDNKPQLPEEPSMNRLYQQILDKAVSRLGTHHISQTIMEIMTGNPWES